MFGVQQVATRQDGDIGVSGKLKMADTGFGAEHRAYSNEKLYTFWLNEIMNGTLVTINTAGMLTILPQSIVII